MRKVAVQLSQDSEQKVTIDEKKVEAFLGKTTFDADELFANIAGVVTGLAWTSMEERHCRSRRPRFPARQRASNRRANSEMS